MDSTSSRRSVAHTTPNTNSTNDKSLRNNSNPKSSADKQPHQNQPQTLSKSEIAAYYARNAIKCSSGILSSNVSNHNLKVDVRRQLVPQYRETFPMSEAQAIAEVEMEMARMYPVNRWDAPGLGQRRRETRVGMASGEQKADGREAQGYGEEQWDLFERMVGYK